MRCVFDIPSEQGLIWEDETWYFADLPFSLMQRQQPPYPEEDSRHEDWRKEGLIVLSQRATLCKADHEALLLHVKKHFVVATVKETAAILRLNDETIRRMIDRGDLDRVPGIRHVRIPLDQVIALSQGKRKDGSLAM